MPDHRQTRAETRPILSPIILTVATPFAVAVAVAVPMMAATSNRDTPVAALERCLAAPANASTAGQSGCEGAAMRGYDRRMNAAYAALIRRLPAIAANRVRLSQRAWLAYRDAEGAARGAIYATRQGTMYVPMEADAATTLVGDRARMLEGYVRALDIE